LVCLFIAIPVTLAQTADPPSADDRPWPSPLLPATESTEPVAPPAPRAATTPNLPWSRLVYYAFGRHQNWDLYYSDDVGSQIVRLTTSKAREVEPDLNRGGTGVVYVSDEDGDFDIYFMRLSDQMRWRVLDTPANESIPVWGPDGRIAFQSDKDGQPEIYVIRADGSGLTRLTNNPDFDGFPTWSPDGRLAFSSRRNGQYRIWVMNADGSGQTRLTHNSDSDFSPSWSPDGTKIVFVSYRPEDGDVYGGTEIYMMDADGGNLVNVTSSVGGDYAPDWRAGVRDTGRRTFMPTADAHVMQSRPTVNFGHKTTLNARQTTKAVNSYVKFRVSSLDTVTEATLRLYVTNPGKNGAVYAASSNYADSTVPWVESGLVWNNAPSVQGAPLTNISPKRAGTWLAVNVTAAVQAAVQANDSHVTLVITNPTADTLVFRSRNATQLRPELVVATQ